MSSNGLESWTCRTRKECNKGNSLRDVIAESLLRERKDKRQFSEMFTVYKQVCGGLTPEFRLNFIKWKNCNSEYTKVHHKYYKDQVKSNIITLQKKRALIKFEIVAYVNILK